MSVTNIEIAKGKGIVTVNVSCPRFPQSIVGIVYRYAADHTKEGKVGEFKTSSPNVPLGKPSEIDTKLFCVNTEVLPFDDDPPTPYEIVVSVVQEGQVLSSEVPDDNGKGTIGSDKIVSLYYFSIAAV